MDKKAAQDTPKPVTLKVLAEYLDLSPATVSIVLNNSPVAKSIAPATRQRVLAAAAKFKYRANVHARMLRTRLSNTIGVMVPELSEGYFTAVMSGVEQCLLQEGYLSYTVSHLYRPDLIEEYPQLLMDRSIDGLLVVNTELRHKLPIPAVSISAHSRIAGVTNLELDHTRAASKALRHLYDLGHRRIAFMKGQPFIPDSELRWKAILTAAGELGLAVRPELCLYLQQSSPSAEIGYQPVRELLGRTRDLTAIFCFNDLAAIGAIRAIEDASLHCPADISVIGFDDISAARFYNPRLTTISQPLFLMGQTAAKLLITRIQSPNVPYPEVVTFEPELVVRESAAGLHRPPSLKQKKSSTKAGVSTGMTRRP